MLDHVFFVKSLKDILFRFFHVRALNNNSVAYLMITFPMCLDLSFFVQHDLGIDLSMTLILHKRRRIERKDEFKKLNNKCIKCPLIHKNQSFCFLFCFYLLITDTFESTKNFSFL